MVVVPDYTEFSRVECCLLTPDFSRRSVSQMPSNHFQNLHTCITKSDTRPRQLVW